MFKKIVVIIFFALSIRTSAYSDEHYNWNVGELLVYGYEIVHTDRDDNNYLTLILVRYHHKIYSNVVLRFLNWKMCKSSQTGYIFHLGLFLFLFAHVCKNCTTYKTNYKLVVLVFAFFHQRKYQQMDAYPDLLFLLYHLIYILYIFFYSQ